MCQIVEDWFAIAREPLDSSLNGNICQLSYCNRCVHIEAFIPSVNHVTGVAVSTGYML